MANKQFHIINKTQNIAILFYSNKSKTVSVNLSPNFWPKIAALNAASAEASWQSVVLSQAVMAATGSDARWCAAVTAPRSKCCLSRPTNWRAVNNITLSTPRPRSESVAQRRAKSANKTAKISRTDSQRTSARVCRTDFSESFEKFIGIFDHYNYDCLLKFCRILNLNLNYYLSLRNRRKGTVMQFKVGYALRNP